MSDERLDFILRLVDKVTGPARGAKGALDSIDASLKKIAGSNALGNVARGAKRAQVAVSKTADEAKRLRNISADLALASGPMQGLGRGMMSAFTAPVGMTKDFDHAMSRVSALTSDFTKQQRDTALKLGETTMYTATQAATAMGNLGMAGFRAGEQMEAIQHVLNLDAAGGLGDLATSASIAARTLRGFGLEASETQRVADVLTATFTNSNTTLTGLGETMAYVAPVAAAAGVPLEDVAKAAGMLGDAGIDGSRAGTSLRLAIANLAGASPPAAKELKRLGVETKDAAGNMLALPKILADIGKATGGMGTGDRIEAITKIFGLRGAPGGVQLARQIAESGASFEKLDKAVVASGQSAKVAHGMWDDMAGDIKLMDSAIEGLGISFGDNFTAPLRGGIQLITDMIGGITDLVKRFPLLSKVLGWTTAIVSGLVFALGTLAGWFGSLALFKWMLVASGAAAKLSAAGAVLGKAWFFVSTIIGHVAGVIGGAFMTAISALGSGIASAAVPFAVFGAAATATVALVLSQWRTVVDFFDGWPSWFHELGADIAEGLITGWRAVFGSWEDEIVNSMTGVTKMIERIMGINSPSKVMAGIGENMAAGLSQGFSGTRGGVATIAPSTVGMGAAAASGGGGMVFSPTVNVTVAGGDGGEETGASIGEEVTSAISAFFDTATATMGG